MKERTRATKTWRTTLVRRVSRPEVMLTAVVT